MSVKYDVVIVGGRCAGAATALLAARAGGRVVVIDKGGYGSDTLSTHALMRGAVLQLHRWNVLHSIVNARTPPVRSTTFRYTHTDVTVAIEPKHGVSALYAPRRTLLDRVLADAAMDAGADIRFRCDVERVLFDAAGRACGVAVRDSGTSETIAADLVVGADGRYSTVAAQVGAATLREARHSTGSLYSYWEGLDQDAYDWTYRRHGSAGLIPTNDATCVFVGLPWQRFRHEVDAPAPIVYRRLIRDGFEELAARLSGARMVERVRGFAGQRGFIKQGSGPGWALVGDAGYFKDPLTAHGITDALRDAELLVRAAARGTDAAFAEYERTRLDLSEKLFAITDEIVSFDWDEGEAQALHRAFSAEMGREVRLLAGLNRIPSFAAHRDLQLTS